MEQATLATAGWAVKTKTTRRGQFLAEMDAVLPWQRFLQLIEPHYPTGEDGRPPYPMERRPPSRLRKRSATTSDPGCRSRPRATR